MCYKVIREDKVGIIEVFGKFHGIAEPGCKCLCCPFGISIVGELSTRIRSITIEVETKTRDNVFVKIMVCTLIEIMKEAEKRYLAFYKFHNPVYQIQSMVEDVVRGVVPLIDLDSIFSQKDEIATSLSQRLTKDLEGCGYKIVSSLILDIRPEKRVVAAMNQIEYERRQRLSQIELSEAAKFADIKRAEAKAEESHLLGVGLAKQRSAIVAGLKESVNEFCGVHNISSSQVLQLMTITQYLDALEELGDGADVFMLPKKHLRPADSKPKSGPSDPSTSRATPAAIQNTPQTKRISREGPNKASAKK